VRIQGVNGVGISWTKISLCTVVFAFLTVVFLHILHLHLHPRRTNVVAELHAVEDCTVLIARIQEDWMQEFRKLEQ
jgi:hypothetical protein